MASPGRSIARTAAVLVSISLGLATAALPAVGCGGEGGSGGASGGGGAGGTEACTSTKGTLTGTAYVNAPPGGANSTIAANAEITLGRSDGTSLLGKADADGHFEIPLDPGTWSVNGDDGTGCIASEAQQVTIEVCQTEDIVLVFDICAG